MENFLRKEMGRRIKEARKKRFQRTVSQKVMAEMIGMSERGYQNWEMGIRSPRNKSRFIKLANILKMDPKELEYGPGKGKFKLNPELKELLDLQEKNESRC